MTCCYCDQPIETVGLFVGGSPLHYKCQRKLNEEFNKAFPGDDVVLEETSKKLTQDDSP